LPVRKVGEDCYQWGNQKVYCGKDAKQKAILQGIAIENTGWKEAEEIDLDDIPPIGIVFPVHFTEIKENIVYIHNHYLIGKTQQGFWRVWNLDDNAYIGNNYTTFPLWRKYSDWRKKNEDAKLVDMIDLEDSIALADWQYEQALKNADKFWNGNDSLSTTFITKGKRRTLQYKMTDEEQKMRRHPNRSSEWIPNRIITEYAEVIKQDMPCPTCGKKRFSSMVEAERHHFYCEKYGIQPQNGLYFTTMELAMVEQGLITKESDTTTQALWITGIAVILGMTIPYFLDSRGNKV